MGGLVEFDSAVAALAAAIDFQQAMLEANRDQPDDKAIVFRIGLHLGDVIVDGDDIYGDDVNVAARLETEAPRVGSLFRALYGMPSRGGLRPLFTHWAISPSRISSDPSAPFEWNGMPTIGP